MRAARYIPTRWMIDREFLDLKADTRMLLVGLWAWPDTPTSGLTITDPTTIGRAFGISARRTRHCIVELAQAGFIETDPDGLVIWLIAFIETQLGQMPNRKHKVATARQIQALPATPMVRRYRQKYGIPDTASHKASDTVSHTLADTASLPVLSVSAAEGGESPTAAKQSTRRRAA